MRTVRRAASIAVSCRYARRLRSHQSRIGAGRQSRLCSPARVRTQAAPSAAPRRRTLPSSSRAVPSTPGAGSPDPATACLAAGFAASPRSEDGGACCAERAAANPRRRGERNDRAAGRSSARARRDDLECCKRRSADRRLRDDLGEDRRRAVRADIHGRAAAMVRSRKLHDAGDRAKHARRCRDTRDTADRALVY